LLEGVLVVKHVQVVELVDILSEHLMAVLVGKQ
jgi:hypothetical protein